MMRVSSILLLVVAASSGALAEEPFSELRIMRDDQYPKVFFFRSSEKIGRSETINYRAWDRDFSQLMGIMGKVLNNELLEITSAAANRSSALSGSIRTRSCSATITATRAIRATSGSSVLTDTGCTTTVQKSRRPSDGERFCEPAQSNLDAP